MAEPDGVGCLGRQVKQKEEGTMADPWQTLRSRLKTLYWDATLRTLPRSQRVHEPLLDEAIALHEAGEYAAAIALLEAAEQCASDPVALNARGLARLGMQNYQGALEDFARADAILRRQRSGVAVNRTATLIQMECYEAAQQAVQEALDLHPQWAVPWVNLLTVHCRRHDLDAAFQAAETMKRVWPAWSTDAELRHYLQTDIELRRLREDPRFEPMFKA